MDMMGKQLVLYIYTSVVATQVDITLGPPSVHYNSGTDHPLLCTLLPLPTNKI